VSEEVGQATGAGVLDDSADGRTAGRDPAGQGGRGTGTESGQNVLRGISRPLVNRREAPPPVTTAEQAISSTVTKG